MKIQKEITAVLKTPICRNPNIAIDEWACECAQVQPECHAENLLQLRIKQLGLDVTEDEFGSLMYKHLEIFFWLEVKGKFNFRQVANLSKKKIADALTQLRART